MSKQTIECKLILAILLIVSGIAFAEIPEGYNTPIPPSIMTPDSVETRLGTLEFFDGVPTQETADNVMENLLFLRGIETFLNGIPATSIEAIRTGLLNLGAKEAPHRVVTEQPWVKDDKTTVIKALSTALGEGTRLEGFARFQLGG